MYCTPTPLVKGRLYCENGADNLNGLQCEAYSNIDILKNVVIIHQERSSLPKKYFVRPRCFPLAPQDGAHHRADAGGEGEGREAVRLHPEVDETHGSDEAVPKEENGQG
jgi:hypothetical protein